MAACNLNAILREVIGGAEAAGKLIAEEFSRPGGPRGADGHAEVDAEVEELLRDRLLRALPARYRGEELGGADPAPGHEAWCWLVDPNDGTSAFLRGHRGSAISVALLRDGVPVLGVVHSPLSPDRGPDTIAWAEGMDGMLRNGRFVRHRLDDRRLEPGAVVFVSQSAPKVPSSNAHLTSPGRFVGLASIAYRLARVAVGDGVAAVSLAEPVSWDYAAGHALLRAAGGILLDERGEEIRYERDGRGACRSCFGGAPEAVRQLVGRDWSTVRSERARRTRVALAWPRVPEGAALDRAAGCLLGLLAGDALGSLVEFHSERSIAAAYPNGVRDLEDGGHWDTLAGQPTDDGELALALARTLARCDGWSSEAVIESYVAWLRSAPFDIGNTTGGALQAAAAAPAGRRKAAASRAADRTSQSNGALMRCAPIGIWAKDEDEAAEAAAEDAALTHPHPICRAASASFAAAIHAGVSGGDRGAMLAAAERILHARDCADLLEDLEAARLSPPETFEHQRGWVRIAWRNAFHHLAVGTSLEEAVIRTVGRGGDTDTNAAICGALLGAAQGREAVPVRWTMRVLSCRPLAEQGAKRPRPPEYWPDDAVELAEALVRRRTA